MKRREVLKIALATAVAAPLARAAGMEAAAARCEGDGTPAQFVPKNAPDANPRENDVAKFPRCPYCGMDRKQLHHSRMLIHYSNDVPDGVCSIHCAAISLSLNVDAEPKGIWVGDNASSAEVGPLVEADAATFLIGGSAPGVMTARSKVAYGSEAAAKAAQALQGGELGGFEQALLAAYTDMAKDVARIRKHRAERKARIQAGPKG
jgi:nitrous oxide reductase accessory protein NosL